MFKTNILCYLHATWPVLPVMADSPDQAWTAHSCNIDTLYSYQLWAACKCG